MNIQTGVEASSQTGSHGVQGMTGFPGIVLALFGGLVFASTRLLRQGHGAEPTL